MSCYLDQIIPVHISIIASLSDTTLIYIINNCYNSALHIHHHQPIITTPTIYFPVLRKNQKYSWPKERISLAHLQFINMLYNVHIMYIYHMKAQGPFSFTENSKCDLGSGCFVPYKQPTIMRINISFLCSVPLVWRGGWAGLPISFLHLSAC